MKLNLRLLYLYLFSFVGLLVVVIGSIQLVNLGIKQVFFKDADVYDYVSAPIKDGENTISVEDQQRQQKTMADRQKQRELSNSVAMILVGVPLYAYHWRIIQGRSE
jgi:hypothetical protein